MNKNLKTLAIGAAVAVAVYLVMKQRANGDALGWWHSLEGMQPGTQQAAMLAEQERAFYE